LNQQAFADIRLAEHFGQQCIPKQSLGKESFRTLAFRSCEQDNRTNQAVHADERSTAVSTAGHGFFWL